MESRVERVAKVSASAKLACATGLFLYVTLGSLAGGLSVPGFGLVNSKVLKATVLASAFSLLHKELTKDGKLVVGVSKYSDRYINCTAEDGKRAAEIIRAMHELDLD